MNAPELMTATQAAAVAAWTNNAPLVAFLGGPNIFDMYVPEGVTVSRYIVVGEQTALPFNALGSRGASATMAVGAWTRGATDRGDVVQIVKLMDAALVAPLTVTGFGSRLLTNVFSTVIPDPDPELRHAPVRYRINAFSEA